MIISASKSFSTTTNTVQKPRTNREGSKEKKLKDDKVQRSKSFGALKS